MNVKLLGIEDGYTAPCEILFRGWMVSRELRTENLMLEGEGNA